MINNGDKHDGHVIGEPEKLLLVDKNTSFNKRSWACYVPKRMLGWSGGGGAHKMKSAAPHLKKLLRGFPGGSGTRHVPANAGDTGSSPGPGTPHVPRSDKPTHHNY